MTHIMLATKLGSYSPEAVTPDTKIKVLVFNAGSSSLKFSLFDAEDEMATTLGGIDTLVLTAGVGEGSPEIRKRICEKLKYLGLELDPAANQTCKPDADISMPASKAR